MKPNFIRCLFFSLAFILSASSIFAIELKSDDGNYIVTVPGTWTVSFQNQSGFSISSSDGSRTMTLITANIGSGKLDSSYITEFEQKLLKAGLKKISSRMFTIDGVPAYEIIQRSGKAQYASVMVDHQIIANSKLYGLHASVMGGDATRDSEMQAGLASFHFLQQPKPSRVGSLGVKLTVVGIIIAGIVFFVVRSRTT